MRLYKYLTLFVATSGMAVIFLQSDHKRALDEVLQSESGHQTLKLGTTLPAVVELKIFKNKDGIQKNSSYMFLDKEHFFEELHKVMGPWRQKRGYYIEDYFAGYRTLENYDGQHPYGYLKEAELEALAQAGDIDAQMIYSYYYLKNSDPDRAYGMFENIVTNTNQTAPLGSMGVFVITGHANKDQFPDQKSREDEASALFLLMKERHDPMGEHYLKLAKFDGFDRDRQEAIKQRAAAIAMEFAELREQQGLGAHEDEIFDGAEAMNMPKETFDQLYAEYQKQNETPSVY